MYIVLLLHFRMTGTKGFYLRKVYTYTENSSKETEAKEPWPEEADAGRVSASLLALPLPGRSSRLICSENKVIFKKKVPTVVSDISIESNYSKYNQIRDVKL